MYAKKTEELELAVNNISAEINKAGLDVNGLNQKEVAVFLKYNYTYEFDEREVNNISIDELMEWVNPKSIQFKSNSFIVDGIETSTSIITEYPLKVKNAWGSNIFNILFILGVSSSISNLTISEKVSLGISESLVDLLVLLLSGVLVFVISRLGKNIKKWQGVIFIVLYVAYIAYIILREFA